MQASHDLNRAAHDFNGAATRYRIKEEGSCCVPLRLFWHDHRQRRAHRKEQEKAQRMKLCDEKQSGLK